MQRVQDLINRYYPPNTHPYRVLERSVDGYIKRGASVLEIGCGREAPVLSAYRGRGARLIGLDLVEFSNPNPELELLHGDVSDMSLIASGSIDIAFSRSVMEHVSNIEACYSEVSRVLVPGGHYIFLTPSFWDYGSLIAHLTPNKFHQKVVKFSEGRAEQDTFPTAYRSNTETAIRNLAAPAGLEVKSLQFLGQYPNYLIFNPFLFRIGCVYAKFLDRYEALRRLRGWIICDLSKKPITVPGT
jgi:SAM-dependent methyltransferase